VIAKATKAATKKVAKTVENPVAKAADTVIAGAKTVKATVAKAAGTAAKPAVAKPATAAKPVAIKAKADKK
jgi:hypothetical protein